MKEFCAFADVEYKRVLKHGNTRFLSLLPAIERFLTIFEGLKSYFNSQEKCPLTIDTFFKDPEGELYFLFVHGQLKTFNTTIMAMEKNNASATEVASAFKTLQLQLKQKKDNEFIPWAAKAKFKQLQDSGETNPIRFKACHKIL